LFKQLLARHGDLEQSENKAQGALVMVLTLTQITELKLLLDLGRTGHRFYEFVMTMLIACICLELFVGIIIIYIGNLHYYSFGNGRGVGQTCWYRFLLCITCCCRSCRNQLMGSGDYQTVGDATSVTAAEVQVRRGLRPGGRTPATARLNEEASGQMGVGCCADVLSGASRGGNEAAWNVSSYRVEMVTADDRFQTARIRVVDAEYTMTRIRNQIHLMEAASAPRVTTTSQQSPAVNNELTEDINNARANLAAAMHLKVEAEADMREAEASGSKAFAEREFREELKEETTFRTLSLWQHAATYLLWFVMLMNVFITTFGISGGAQNVFGSTQHRSLNNTSN